MSPLQLRLRLLRAPHLPRPRPPRSCRLQPGHPQLRRAAPARGAQPAAGGPHPGLVLGDPGHGGPQPEQEQPREVGVGVREQPGRHDEVRLQLQHEEAGQAEELRGGREAGEECGR